MAKQVLRDAQITVDGTDLSANANEVTIETTFDEAEATGFGAVYKEILQGLGDATITITFFQDFAAGSVDAVLWPLSQSGATFPVVVKPSSAAVSAANPSFTMTAVLLSYNPVAGSVGDVSSTECQFRNAAQTGLVRATA